MYSVDWIEELLILLLEARLFDCFVAKYDEKRVEARIGESGSEAAVEEPIAVLVPEITQYGKRRLFFDCDLFREWIILDYEEYRLNKHNMVAESCESK